MSLDVKTPETYRYEVERLGTALSAQAGWLKDLHVALFGKGPGSIAEAEEVPEGIKNRRSPFYTWYHGLAEDLFDESPVFAALGLRLEAMETHARHLAETVARGLKFPEDDYAAFMDSVIAFNELAFKLQREGMNLIAGVDDLTGVGDENAMADQIIAERERVRRSDQKACLTFAEIGDYSSDTVSAGNIGRNEVIVGFSETVANKLRPYDHLYRIDNDRFALCLPYTETSVAELVIQRLKDQMAGGALTLDDGTEVNVQSYYGIASIEAEDLVDDVRERAQIALDIARTSPDQDVVIWTGE